MKTLLSSIALFLVLSSCGSENKEVGLKQEVKPGLEVEYLQSYSKKTGELGNVIEYDFIQTYKGKVLANTFQIPDYRARTILKEPDFEGDYMEVLLKSAIDDSISIKVDLKSLPLEQLPKGLEGKEGTLDFIITIRDIWNEEEIIDGMVNRLTDGKPDLWTKTGRGVRIFWDEKGDGEKAEFGDSVKIHVKGLFPTGAPFMSTFDKKPIEFLLGEGLISPKAWEDACALVSKGDKLTVISPYDMAFGAVDRKPILKYSILVFEIDVVDVIKPY